MYCIYIQLPLQNIANTLFDRISEIKGPLLYYFRFEGHFKYKAATLEMSSAPTHTA